MNEFLQLPPDSAPQVFSFLAESIEFAHKIAPSKWGLTPLASDGVMRLNMRFPEVLTIDGELIRVFVNKPIAEKLEIVQRGDIELSANDSGGDIYPSAPGSRLISLKLDGQIGLYLDIIKEAHFENIKSASSGGGLNVGIRNGHRDWAVKALGEKVGRELPLPSYAANYARSLENFSVEKEFESERLEGARIESYSTRFERDFRNREEAVKLHGVTCMACGFNFANFYGDHGEGYIHVHHNKPLHTLDEATSPDPQTELEVLCPNCHAMIHRKKVRTLSLGELKDMISRQRGDCSP